MPVSHVSRGTPRAGSGCVRRGFPLVSRDAVLRYEAAIRAVKEQGGEILFGGRAIERPGHFVEPTLVRAPRQDAFPIGWEETFAPILYFMRYDTFDEAIAIHNNVPQGLASAIFTNDVREAERFCSPAGARRCFITATRSA